MSRTALCRLCWESSAGAVTSKCEIGKLSEYIHLSINTGTWRVDKIWRWGKYLWRGSHRSRSCLFEHDRRFNLRLFRRPFRMMSISHPHIYNVQYIPRNMHTVFALLCFVVVIHWLIFPYPSGLLHWHCLTIAPVPAKQPWWIWINTSCEFIMNDCITTTKQSTTKPCAYFLGYTVCVLHTLMYENGMQIISERFSRIQNMQSSRLLLCSNITGYCTDIYQSPKQICVWTHTRQEGPARNSYEAGVKSSFAEKWPLTWLSVAFKQSVSFEVSCGFVGN